MVRRVLTNQLAELGTARVIRFGEAGRSVFPPTSGGRGRQAVNLAKRAGLEMGADLVVWVTTSRRADRWRMQSTVVDVTTGRSRAGPRGTVDYAGLHPFLGKVTVAVAKQAGLNVTTAQLSRIHRVTTPDPRVFETLGLALVMPVGSPAAEAKARAALQRDPAFVEAHMRLGRLYAARGDYAAAVETYERVRNIRPEHPHVDYNLGLSYRALGDYRRAVNAYERARRFDPEDPDIVVNLGTAYYLTGDLPAAQDAFRDSVALAPHDRRALANLRTVEDALQAPLLAPDPAATPETEPVRSAGIAAAGGAPPGRPIAPTAPAAPSRPLVTPGDVPVAVDPQIYVDTGAIFFARGEFERAMEQYEKATAADPDDLDTLRLLGQTYQRLGRNADAVAAYIRVVARAPRDHETQARLDQALSTVRLTGRDPNAPPVPTRTGITDVDIAQTYFRKGKRHFVRGEFDDAVAAYTRALQITPEDATLLNSLGVAQYEAGRLDDAKRSFVRALELSPDDATIERNMEALRGAHDRARLAEAEAAGAFSLIRADADPALAPEIAFLEGNEAYAAGEFDVAIAAYDRALALNPAHAKAWNNRGALLVRVGRFADAADAFTRAAETTDDELVAANAEVAHVLLRYASAGEEVRTLTIALREDPALDYRYRMAVARDAYNRADYGRAADAYATIVQRFDEKAEPLNNLAAVYFMQGDADAALAAVDAALARDPQGAVSRHNRDVIVRAQWLTVAASTGEAGTDPGAADLGIVLQYAAGTDEASPREQPATSPPQSQDAAALVAQASADLADGDPAAAETRYRRVTSADNRNMDAVRGMGAALATQGKWSAAMQAYRQALELEPRHVPTLMGLGYAALRGGETETARQAFRRAVQLAPDSAKAQYNLAISERRAGDLSAAIAANRQALRLAPTFADAHYNLANLYLEAERWDAATTAFHRVLEMDPGNVAAFNNLGIAHWRLSDLDTALRMWREALRLDPACEFARANLNRFGRHAALSESPS